MVQTMSNARRSGFQVRSSENVVGIMNGFNDNESNVTF